MNPLRILLVDDQKLFAQSMKVLIEASDLPLESVRVANSGEDAVIAVDAHPLDVVLLDVHMPGVDGLEVLRRIRLKNPAVKVIMLSAFGYDEYVREALDAGARGYLLKDEMPAVVIGAIRQVMEGGMVISEQTLPAFTTGRLSGCSDGNRPPDWLAYLSEKERRILYYISVGQDNHEIAATMNLSYQTIRNYVSSIYSKLGINSRFRAMRIGIEACIGDYIVDL